MSSVTAKGLNTYVNVIFIFYTFAKKSKFMFFLVVMGY